VAERISRRPQCVDVPQPERTPTRRQPVHILANPSVVVSYMAAYRLFADAKILAKNMIDMTDVWRKNVVVHTPDLLILKIGLLIKFANKVGKICLQTDFVDFTSPSCKRRNIGLLTF